MADRDTSPAARREWDILEQLQYCARCAELGNPYSHSEGIWEQAADALAKLRQAGRAVLAEPHGCVYCDSGKLRNPKKYHSPECGFALLAASLSP